MAVDFPKSPKSPCSQCGAPLSEQALFCPGCGTAVSQVAAEVVRSTDAQATIERLQPGGIPLVASGGGTTGDALPIPENIAGVVAYLTILPAVVFLFIEPFRRNRFVRFHAFQHLYLWVAGFVFGVAAGILSMLLQLIPFMRVLVFPLAGLISLAWFFLWVLLVVKAYHHKMFKLPVIGDLAEQQAGV
jgi:uncharacterized membrane protein